VTSFYKFCLKPFDSRLGGRDRPHGVEGFTVGGKMHLREKKMQKLSDKETGSRTCLTLSQKIVFLQIFQMHRDNPTISLLALFWGLGYPLDTSQKAN
jgi:hypothetical protein